MNELYADNLAYGWILLKHFNVFGRRQDPNGAYAAVMQVYWVIAKTQSPVIIDEVSRDFAIDNVMQMNGGFTASRW